MNKRKKVSRVEEYAIRYLYDTIKMDVDTISKELNISVSSITKLVDDNKNPANIPTATSNTNHTDKNIVLNQTQNKNTGVSIMTQQGSIAGDGVYNSTQDTVSRTARNAIYRPRG
jgi:hypothetical protein